MKWVIELGEHEIQYLSQKAIKGQVMTNFFIVMENETVAAEEPSSLVPPKEYLELWKFFVDGASFKG